MRHILAALLEKEPAARPTLGELESTLQPIAFPPPTPTVAVTTAEENPEPVREEPLALPRDPRQPEAPEPAEAHRPTQNSGRRSPVTPGISLAHREPEPTGVRRHRPEPAAVLPQEPESGVVPRHEAGPAVVRRHRPEPAAVLPQEPESAAVPRHEPDPTAGLRQELDPAAGLRHAPEPAVVPRHEADPAAVPRHEPQPPAVPRHEAETDRRPGPALVPGPGAMPPGELLAPDPGPTPPGELPAPGPAPTPPGEPPGPAVPVRPRPARRGPVLLAAAGLVTAGVVVAVVLLMNSGGSSEDDKAGGPAASSSVYSPSPSPTVEGTARPQTLPPGARTEAGGFAWVPPEGWRRDVKTGAEVHYTSPDGTQELVAKSSLAHGDLMETWETSEQNAHQGQAYQKIRLEETTFRGSPAVVWEYTFTLEGVPWHARLLGFNEKGKSYQINTWYQPDIEDRALRTYEKVKDSFTLL
ncbi:hypothetical protein ACWD1Z_29695 [Streptomyces sp. NPDC002784]